MKINCIIDKTLDRLKNRKKRISVLSRYLRMHYKINVEESVLNARVKKLKIA